MLASIVVFVALVFLFYALYKNIQLLRFVWHEIMNEDDVTLEIRH